MGTASVNVWRSHRTGVDAVGQLKVLDGTTIEFVAEDAKDGWTAAVSDLSIKWPWYSLGAAIKIGLSEEKARLYMFYPPKNRGTVGNGLDTMAGRKAGKRIKAALQG